MLKLISYILKTTLFIVLILILGQIFSWNGKTVSDQIKTQLAQAEYFSVQEIKSWANKLVGTKNKLENNVENISLSERQKLKSLIRELNSSRQNPK
jgi:predicted PurR-regulated permease PerM